MKRYPFIALLLISMIPVVLACQARHEGAEVGDAEDTAPAAIEREAAGTDHPSDLNPAEAQTMVDDVTIGKAKTADGRIEVENQTDDFAPGQTVVISMDVSDATAGSAVKVAYFGPGETKVTEQEKPIAVGEKYLAFEADTKNWPKGDYRAEVWIGDEKVNTQQFQIVDKSEAGK